MAAAKRFVAAFEQNRVARRPGWKKNITDRTIVRKGSGDKTPEEGQDLDRQENRRYRSGGDRDRGRGEGSRRGEEAGSRGRGLAVPSAGSVVAAAGHRVPVACANRGRARPTPAARLGLRLRVDTPLLRKATRG